MAFPSMTRVASKNPKLFVALIAVVAVGSGTILLLQELAPDSGAAQTGLVIAMFLVCAVYVGTTHEEPGE
ncbi:hypothetical protein [Halorientalis pallida]|uniref:Uncharacterized protein n=1 Tax=Halorientalis pallida TaxID=2479928 RepID=A0A498KZ01_9EURY|nr:hypothetical protein [Halorientalis pallida]RXK47263.1 hypothetical protein EAF64_15885 [Halorientalis pallida]